MEGTFDPFSFVLVNHIAYSGLHIGHSLNDEHEVTQACDLWKGSKIEKHITMTHSLRHAQWNKLAWNIPFNGLTIALGDTHSFSPPLYLHTNIDSRAQATTDRYRTLTLTPTLPFL